MNEALNFENHDITVRKIIPSKDYSSMLSKQNTINDAYEKIEFAMPEKAFSEAIINGSMIKELAIQLAKKVADKAIQTVKKSIVEQEPVQEDVSIGNDSREVLKSSEEDIIKYKEDYEQRLKVKEEEIMRQSDINKLLDIQMRFFIISSLLTITSLIAMVIYYITKLYFIHPILYVAIFIMGIGWGGTALLSMWDNRKLCVNRGDQVNDEEKKG